MYRLRAGFSCAVHPHQFRPHLQKAIIARRTGANPGGPCPVCLGERLFRCLFERSSDSPPGCVGEGEVAGVGRGGGVDEELVQRDVAGHGRRKEHDQAESDPLSLEIRSQFRGTAKCPRGGDLSCCHRHLARNPRVAFFPRLPRAVELLLACACSGVQQTPLDLLLLSDPAALYQPPSSDLDSEACQSPLLVAASSTLRHQPLSP